MSYPGSPPGEQQSDQPYSYPTPSTGGAYPPPPPSPDPAPTAEYGQPAFGQPSAPPADLGQPGAYGQPAAFGQPSAPPADLGQPGAYGQPAAFGQPSAPPADLGQPGAYGQPAAYGQPSAPPATQGFGVPAQPVSPAFGVNVPTQQVPAHDQGATFTPYTPGTAQIPAYGEPTSGYAYGAEPPMSGPPVSPSPVMGGPVPFGAPAPPQPKRGVAVPILASLLALAVIAAGVFIGLYVDKSSKLTKSQQLASQRQDTINTTNAELDKTKKDLQTKADELTKAEQDLRGTKNDSDQAKKERDIIAKCLTLLTQALDASAKGDKATTQAKINEMKDPCDQAFTIIGI